jgi:hypothetical protein
MSIFKSKQKPLSRPLVAVRNRPKTLRKDWLTQPLNDREVRVLEDFLKVRGGINYAEAMRELGKQSGVGTTVAYKSMMEIAMRYIYQVLERP